MEGEGMVMKRLKKNFDLIVIAAIVIVFVAVSIWIKVYPTIQDPLIDSTEGLEVNYIIQRQDTDTVSEWGIGPRKIDSGLQQEVLDVLETGTTTRVFRSSNAGKVSQGTTYEISILDGEIEKRIMIGKGTTTYADIRDGENVRTINEPEQLVAALEEVLLE